jgi:trimethylamine:corrinoid methyltransferase-like protein
VANPIERLTAATARRRDGQEAWEAAIVAAAAQGWSHDVIAHAAGVEEVDVRRVLRKRTRASRPADAR